SVLLTGPSDGIYKSFDSGMTWSLQGKWPYDSSYNLAVMTGHNLLALSFSGRALVSKDDGASWNKADQGLPPTYYGTPPRYHSREFNGFAIIGNNVLCFSNAAEYISYDHGLTWNFKRDSCPFVSSKLITVGKNILAAGLFGIYLSEDS